MRCLLPCKRFSVSILRCTRERFGKAFLLNCCTNRSECTLTDIAALAKTDKPRLLGWLGRGIHVDVSTRAEMRLGTGHVRIATSRAGIVPQLFQRGGDCPLLRGALTPIPKEHEELVWANTADTRPPSARRDQFWAHPHPRLAPSRQNRISGAQSNERVCGVHPNQLQQRRLYATDVY